jgi:glycosyltransferase involved in cell wall biosynthesis
MAKMTGVLHISNTDIEFDSRIRKEVKALSQLPGIQVSSVGVPQINEDGDAQLDGARYRKLRLASRGLKLFPRAIRYFVQLIEFTFKVVAVGRHSRPDIVHCHDTFALPAGWILKRQLGCHLVYDAHELESNKNAQNAILSWATLLIEKACWRQVDLLISVSDSIIDWYTRNLGPKPNVVILNSPAIAADSDPRFGAKARGSYFHEKYGIPADTLVFVYVGLFSPGRGIEICLNAFAAGPRDAHVVFIGFGRLEQAITEYSRLHPNIHFHEAVPHDQVVSLVRSADYGLCLIEKASLSGYYCLPNKLFEYCFAQVPVLASDFPEISRLVEQYSLGVCCNPDPVSVRAALSQLIKRRAVRVTSDVTALSWETQASRLTAAYRDQLMAPLGARPSI